MAEIKSFAADASWAIIDTVETFLHSPHQQRFGVGVTAYLLGAFLFGNGLSEVYYVFSQS